MTHRLSRLLSLAAVCAFACAVAPPARAALPAPKRAALARYLDALRAGNYAAAFASLSSQEKRYFLTSANFASIFVADRFKVQSYKIIGSTDQAGATVALVAEHVTFFDHAHQTPGALDAKVPYGIIGEHGGYTIKDPYHPWRALAPGDWSAANAGVRVMVRKISFFTGRVELVMTFENRGDATVTVLPYGRSVLRDDASRVHNPIETKIASLTDKTLYMGLRLAPNARYTGAMTFFTADRFTPKTLSGTIAPVLADGADAPFELELPAFEVSR